MPSRFLDLYDFFLLLFFLSDHFSSFRFRHDRYVSFAIEINAVRLLAKQAQHHWYLLPPTQQVFLLLVVDDIGSSSREFPACNARLSHLSDIISHSLHVWFATWMNSSTSNEPLSVFLFPGLFLLFFVFRIQSLNGPFCCRQYGKRSSSNR